ncbi:MAG: hypothetical protein N0A16_00305 [Blastocatellia bacterium]|nr:hypothetical protein [Blastocatellia bacterium]MCS7156152.1 hypothetical protein [Blastocatellia bacterium]MCX7751497.1 hypothetical protein [Blastocatellia bacterium]MDW8169210.1 hypothetical protein [Acidobacteriota bacterium]MDW8256071.1 hypothetical protein [Acidobacteriota bacterium]
MGHVVFEWVIAIAVLVVFALNIVFLWRINENLKALMLNSQRMNERLNTLLDEARGVLGDARGAIAALVGEARPVVRAIATTTEELTDMIHRQALEVRGLLRDTVLVLRNKVEQLDDLVTRTTERVDETTAIIQRQILEPVREIHYLTTAIRRAAGVLFAGRRKSVDRVYQDEELFIG